jgi:hypothetical protein
MNKELAEKVYLFILENFVGWSKEDFAELSIEEIHADPIFEYLCELN